MSDYAFAYYFPAFFDYLRSDHSGGDGNTFLSIHANISFRHGTMKTHFPHCREEVIACLRYCADHIQKFDVNRVINSLHTGRNYEPPLEHIIRELLAEVSGDVSPAADSNRLPSEIPTLIDISPTNCLNLDERSAVENFLGKTFDEAKAMFFDHAERYTEDLGWMGRTAFNFYFPAYAAYLKSDAACPDDFMWVTTAIFIQGNPAFHELRDNPDVVEVIEYGIKLLSKPENKSDPYFQQTLRDLIELKNQIMGYPGDQ